MHWIQKDGNPPRMLSAEHPPVESGVSLQKGEATNQIKEVNQRIHNWMDECEDFLETAALIEQLDLVISADTAVAHLAGALGKPVWLLNRYNTDWRWLLNRSDSPWYSSMRIFRQPKMNDWDTVVAAVRHELALLDK